MTAPRGAFIPDAVAILIVGGIVAYAAPAPHWQTDRDIYERMGREWIVPGCNDFHCFRPLVSWLLGVVPGPALLIWKGYAVICQVVAGFAMALWALRWGATVSTARMIAWLTALGSGACYTLFDPHTSDPLMHALGPILMLLIDYRRHAVATATAAIGVMAKEFAAVPLVIGVAYRALRAQWQPARQLAAGTALVIGLWAAWQFLARTQFGYTTGPTYSADLTTGGYLVFWLLTLSPALVATLVAMVLGGLWVLWAAGLVQGSRELRQLTFASVPALLIFNALQQPDRALWNFAFVVMPAAAVVLNRVPAALGWSFVAAQTLLNLRFGAQLSQVPSARISFSVAVALALAIVWRARASAAPATA